jgi:Bacterial regulatory proteins, tetR family
MTAPVLVYVRPLRVSALPAAGAVVAASAQKQRRANDAARQAYLTPRHGRGMTVSERSVNAPTGTRRRQAQERREQLIDTALEVFAAKGLENATVKDLSEAAGVGAGLAQQT